MAKAEARKHFDPAEYRLGKNNASATTLEAIPPFSAKHLRRDAIWRGNHLIFGRRVVASIVPDLAWSSMWHVKIGDGHGTDMVNLTRAKDAALALVYAGGAAR